MTKETKAPTLKEVQDALKKALTKVYIERAENEPNKFLILEFVNLPFFKISVELTRQFILLPSQPLGFSGSGFPYDCHLVLRLKDNYLLQAKLNQNVSIDEKVKKIEELSKETASLIYEHVV